MMAAEVGPDGTRILAQDRQVTRLGESVFQQGEISSEALNFLCATLQRMAATYQKLEVTAVRAVATSAVRDARNQAEFSQRVSEALGTAVEIISGQEEARLIYLGVEARWPRPEERTLIIDVGGGSAEFIITHHGRMIDASSRPLGAVRLKQLFLNQDPASEADLLRLHQYIEEKLAPFAERHRGTTFDRLVATSSTAAALVCAANEIPRSQRDAADRVRASTNKLRRFYEKVSREPLAQRRKWPGVGPRRAEIIVGGAAVFLRALEEFGQSSLYYSAAGVRDGIIADLAARRVGQEQHSLSREQRAVVEAMAQRYGVSLAHAQSVAFLACRLFEQTTALHQLPAGTGKLLEAAAYLHDVGHYVSGTSHHKHSAYLVANSDLPGFREKERLIIAALCRFHRKSMPQSRHLNFQELDAESKRAVLYLVPLLRIADSLDRSHEQKIRDVQFSVRNGIASLQVEAQTDPDLELWAVGEVAPAFRDVYGVSIAAQKAISLQAEA
jgi:exopolyphosphatase / guanosine-5'-triphosphate,3'-diphosphate pyrophosphatase